MSVVFQYRVRLHILLLTIAGLVANACLLDSLSAQNSEVPDIPKGIAATVNGSPITLAQIEFEFAKTVGELKLSGPQIKTIQKTIRERLISQRVVIAFLNDRQSGAGKNQIGEKIDELEARLAAVGKTLGEHLKEIKLSEPDLKSHFEWQIAWTKYLDQKLDDEFLQTHFNNKKRKFDGSEIKVAHLFLQSDQTDRKTRTQQLATAAEIRQQIQANELTWDEALKKHSQAPTRDSGGEIGWIKHDGPMPKTFTNVAFEMKLGQLSEPVETTYGIHIIKCVEIKEGKIGWRDNLEAVKADAALTLFQTIVKQHRDKTKIVFIEPN